MNTACSDCKPVHVQRLTLTWSTSDSTWAQWGHPSHSLEGADVGGDTPATAQRGGCWQKTPQPQLRGSRCQWGYANHSSEGTGVGGEQPSYSSEGQMSVGRPKTRLRGDRYQARTPQPQLRGGRGHIPDCRSSVVCKMLAMEATRALGPVHRTAAPAFRGWGYSILKDVFHLSDCSDKVMYHIRRQSPPCSRNCRGHSPATVELAGQEQPWKNSSFFSLPGHFYLTSRWHVGPALLCKVR